MASDQLDEAERIAAPRAASQSVPVPARRATHLIMVQPNATTGPRLPRLPFTKQSHDDLLKTQHDDSAVVKFAEGTAIRLRGLSLAIVEPLLDMDRAMRYGVTRSRLDVEVEQVRGMLQKAGAQMTRLFSSTAEDVLSDQRIRAEGATGRELADLNLFFLVRFPGKKPEEVVYLLDTLNDLDIVEYAASNEKPAPPPQAQTPNFEPNQGYLLPAPQGGIDAYSGRSLAGGYGAGVRIADVEYGWRATHEDFPQLVSWSGDNTLYREHGTAVIGEIAGRLNGFGVTGIAPQAEISMASPTVNGVSNLPDAIQRAINQTRPGDIILIEQQTYCLDQALCPVEWRNDVFAVNENAVGAGRVVLLAAANGGLNLDDVASFGDRFQRQVRDSGSIYVGAGTSNTHAPLSFSNYGTRLDVQGWGENVTTMSYGDLFYPNSNDDRAYTSTFNGTSSATPIAAAAAAITQAIRKSRGLPDLTSRQMRDALLVGATPQAPGVHIGPLPDLRDMVAAIPVPAPNIVATGAANGTATISWPPVPGVAGYEIFRKSSHGAAWTLLQSAVPGTQYVDSGLAGGTSHLYRVRAYDGLGTRSPDSNQELATTIDYADAQLVAGSSLIRAQHIVQVRTAVNAICAYAGPAICPAPPFSGNALSEAYMQTQMIWASDWNAVRDQIATLRGSIGASPAAFRETMAPAGVVRAIHMDDMRAGAK